MIDIIILLEHVDFNIMIKMKRLKILRGTAVDVVSQI